MTWLICDLAQARSKPGNPVLVSVLSMGLSGIVMGSAAPSGSRQLYTGEPGHVWPTQEHYRSLLIRREV